MQTLKSIWTKGDLGRDVLIALAAVVIIVAGFKVGGVTITHDLTVAFLGQGTGSVVWDRGRGTLDRCAGPCVVPFPNGRAMLFTATAKQGSEFVRWDGACTGKAQTCLLDLGEDRQIFAVFEKVR
jgi:hypothetical protein